MLERDTASASRVLTHAAGTRWGQFEALVERSRMLREWKDYPGARNAASRALVAAATDAERDDATVSWAAAMLAPLLQDRLRRAEAPRQEAGRKRRGIDATASPDATASFDPTASRDTTALSEVVSRLDRIVQRSPGELEAARLLILAGALAGDAPALFAGWRSYYLVGTGDTLRSLLEQPRRMLRNVAGWHATAPAALARQRSALVAALADSRLFTAAALVALTPGRAMAPPKDARAREIVAYAVFLDSARSATNRYYRKTALGKGHPGRLEGRAPLHRTAPVASPGVAGARTVVHAEALCRRARSQVRRADQPW